MLKLRGYHKASSPGIDDTQIPGSAITTDVNIEQVRINGLEGVLEFRPGGPLSGFANLALDHAYGTGAVTGAFLAETPPAQPFDLDHDQRLSSVLGLHLFRERSACSPATGIYGSGLTNGVTPNAPGLPGYDPTIDPTPVLGTGLFAFNKAFKVDPNFIVNASAGYTIKAGRQRSGRRSSSTTSSTTVRAQGRVLQRGVVRAAAGCTACASRVGSDGCCISRAGRLDDRLRGAPGRADPTCRGAGLEAGTGRAFARIEGQSRGLQKMVDEERDANELLMQIASIREALHGAAALILVSHLAGMRRPFFWRKCDENERLVAKTGGCFQEVGDAEAEPIERFPPQRCLATVVHDRPLPLETMGIRVNGGLKAAIWHSLAGMAVFAQVLMLFTPLIEAARHGLPRAG